MKSTPRRILIIYLQFGRYAGQCENSRKWRDNMKGEVQIIYKKVPMVVQWDSRDDCPILESLIFHEVDDWYIDNISVGPDDALNDLVHELLGEDEFFKKAVIQGIQENIEQSAVDLAIMGGAGEYGRVSHG